MAWLTLDVSLRIQSLAVILALPAKAMILLFVVTVVASQEGGFQRIP
jgi:hypothetical protein